MRLHIWTDDDLPPVHILEDETIQVFDYPSLIGLEVGDQIQYLTDAGTSVYFVVDVQPESQGDPEDQRMLVTLEGA